MSNSDLGYVVIRGGLVESAPEDLDIFDMDTLDGSFVDQQVIDEVLALRNNLAKHVNVRAARGDIDPTMTALIAECDKWLHRNNVTATCAHCGDDIACDDNGTGGTVWVHEYESTVCGDMPPGTLSGDNLTVATPTITN